jgi:indole-3-glycerol phosphate synthase
MDLKEFGFQGFLVGENFMRTDDPGLSAQNFIKNIAR